MSLVLLHVAVTIAAARDRRCSYPEQQLPACYNRTHFTLVDGLCGEHHHENGTTRRTPNRCNKGFKCSPSTGGCVADNISIHLLRSADYQIVETVDVAEAATCSVDPLQDAITGKMVCEVIHATGTVQPTFAHSLGNTWTTAPQKGSGTIDSCTFDNVGGWRRCIGENVAKLGALIVSKAPHIMLSAGLMEYLHRYNIDGHMNELEFAAKCCVPGTLGSWGDGNNTCVPDVRSSCAQQYYIEWGKVFLDAGIRAFFFGQSRLTGGDRQCNPDGTGCSRVSVEGANGFAVVLTALKEYASSKGYGRVYFGPQAASGFELANGSEIADWAYGAQHLYARDQWLVQPFSVNGTPPATGPQWYGLSDLHDANRLNNANGLPVMLDFDNFSGDEDRPDDIRRLSSWPNATRASFVQTLWYTMRFYNPRVTVSIPFSKQLAVDPAWNQPQSQCWSGQKWGENDGLFFGAYSCGIVDVAAKLLKADPYPNTTDVLTAVNIKHFGTALQSSDLTCVWAFNTLLRRDFSSAEEYQACVKALPAVVLGARGARAKLAKAIIESQEMERTACIKSPGCIYERLQEYMCLLDPDCTAPSSTMQNGTSLVDSFARSADGLNLFGNAALIDPAWRLGD